MFCNISLGTLQKPVTVAFDYKQNEWFANIALSHLAIKMPAFECGLWVHVCMHKV